MSYGVGTVTAIDEKGAEYEAVCNFGCPHTVTPRNPSDRKRTQ